MAKKIARASYYPINNIYANVKYKDGSLHSADITKLESYYRLVFLGPGDYFIMENGIRTGVFFYESFWDLLKNWEILNIDERTSDKNLLPKIIMSIRDFKISKILENGKTQNWSS